MSKEVGAGGRFDIFLDSVVSTQRHINIILVAVPSFFNAQHSGLLNFGIIVLIENLYSNCTVLFNILSSFQRI